MVDYPALGGIDDPSQVRVALVVNKQIAHVPLGELFDATLTALAALDATPGFVVQTGVDTFVKRLLAAGIGITITNPAGTAGNSSIALAAGTVVDRAYAEYLTNANLTTVIPADDTPPLIGEGTEILSVALTPKTTTNRIRGIFIGSGASSAAAGNVITASLHINGGTSVRAVPFNISGANSIAPLTLIYEYVPGVTTAQTISIRVGPNTGTLRMNGTSAGRIFGGAMGCVLLLEELVA